MLESMLVGGRQPWTPPPMDSNTLLRLVDFTTVSDIVDRSPNNIAITKSGTFVIGSDSIHSYMQFTGTQWLTFVSSLLNRTNIELTFVLGSIPYASATYTPPILDTRPASTNGNYHILGVGTNQPLPFKLIYNYPSNTFVTLDANIANWPTVIKLQLRSTGTKIYVDGALVHDIGTVSSLNSANLKIGRSAFSSAVPNLQAKLYFLEIKALT